MCTHFNDNIFICSKVNTLTWLDARALTCFGDWTVRCMCTWMCKFSCAYMFTCFIDHVFAFVLTLTIICSHVYLFWWSHTSMCTCFDVHMLLCAHALMVSHFYIHMLWWYMLSCLHALTRTCPLSNTPWCSYAQTFFWLHAPMFTFFVDHVLLCLHASMVECFHVHMLWW